MLSKLLSFMRPLPDAEQKVPEHLVHKTYKMWRIRMFLGMYIGYVVFYFTRKNESFVRPLFGDAMGMTVIELGILGTIMYVTYGIGKFLNGLLADRCNIKVFMATGLLGASIVNIFFPFSPCLWVLYVLWGLNGIFQSMGFPPIAKGLVHWYAPKERATMWTLWSSSHTCGAFLIGVIASFFLASNNWQAVFYVSGIIGLITSIGILLTLTDRPQSVGLPKIEDYKNDQMPVKPEPGLTHGQILMKYVLKNRFLWLLAFAYVFVYFVRFATLDWTTKFMVDRGFTDEAAALYLTAMPLLGIFGGIVAGWIADRFFQGRCSQINIIYLILLAISIWGFYKYSAVDNTFANLFFLGAIGFLVDGPQNLVGGVQTSRVTVQQAASAATGFTGMFGYLGAVLSGVGAALIINKFGWGGFFTSCVIACIISIFLITMTRKQEEAPKENSKTQDETFGANSEKSMETQEQNSDPTIASEKNDDQNESENNAEITENKETSENTDNEKK